MNLFIYILLLPIWTHNCLNTTIQSDGSSTTGAKPSETMETKMDSFRRRLLIIVIGVMIIAFVFTCFCFLHFNCMSDDSLKTGVLKKEGMALKTPRSSKMSFSESKTTSLYGPEKQCTLSTLDNLSRPLTPDMLSILSSAEKSNMPSTPDKSSIPYSTEKSGPLSPEKSSIPSSAEELMRPSSPKKLFKPSSSKKQIRSSHLEKSYRIRSLKKSYKVSPSHKRVNQVSSFNPNKTVRPAWSANLQYATRSSFETRCSPHPQNAILPHKPSRVQNLAKTHRHLKSPVSTGKEALISSPQLDMTCQCYKEKCLICKTFPEPLVSDISEAKKRKAQNLSGSSKEKPFPWSFLQVDSRDDVYNDNVSDSDLRTYNTDDDSDREITIICSMRQTEAILKRISRALPASTPSRCGTPRLGPAVSVSSFFNPLGKPGAGVWGSSQPAERGGVGDSQTTTPRLLWEQSGGGDEKKERESRVGGSGANLSESSGKTLAFGDEEGSAFITNLPPAPLPARVGVSQSPAGPHSLKRPAPPSQEAGSPAVSQARAAWRAAPRLPSRSVGSARGAARLPRTEEGFEAARRPN
ncbi:uncharacterized protein CXorf66 homolog [Nycticebus coucang]|uniref:uncharacterized protein CXorf66 homolog n=1 Tax=Nycticebus coucang TaxID=9470 RepID=UPI00234CDCD9|nr:uncharacterized protein CXorf66 homolog [Nycticebus coucang]